MLLVAVVDDDGAVQKAVARLLRAHGIDVRTAKPSRSGCRSPHGTGGPSP